MYLRREQLLTQNSKNTSALGGETSFSYFPYQLWKFQVFVCVRSPFLQFSFAVLKTNKLWPQVRSGISPRDTDVL